MTSIFDADGKNIPCTVIEAGPCVVTQLRTVDTDGYTAVQLAFSDKKEKNTTGSLERFLHRMFLLFVLLAGLGFAVWLQIRSTSEVISSQSIGRFERMSGPGGLAGDVVIETEQGLYLLHGAPAITKGTLLILEVRATGAHFICDEARSLCLRTSSKKFTAGNALPIPNAPAAVERQAP